MYARPTVDGEVLDFGVSGKLTMNGLVMYDRQTDSLWSQILGQAIEGPLAGSLLRPIPSLFTTWGQWLELHPDTLALEISRGGSDPYTSYYSSGEAGVLGETVSDDRLAAKDLVTGAVIDGQAIAYPWAALGEIRVANHIVGRVPVLATHDPATSTTMLYSRTVGGRTLTFRWDRGDREAFVLIDAETNSRWTAWNGAAFDGPLAGKALERIPSTSAFWFGWKDFHPDTQIYGRDA